MRDDVAEKNNVFERSLISKNLQLIVTRGLANHAHLFGQKSYYKKYKFRDTESIEELKSSQERNDSVQTIQVQPHLAWILFSSVTVKTKATIYLFDMGVDCVSMHCGVCSNSSTPAATIMSPHASVRPGFVMLGWFLVDLRPERYRMTLES